MLNSAINRVILGVCVKRRIKPGPLKSSHERGAAILMALIVVAIAVTMASTMLARQQATLVGEEARRHATQARWILRGAMDWARLVLREDARSNSVDHLGEAWAVPLKPISLKAFLAVNERADDAVFEAMLQGRIEDAQAKFNLRNLEINQKPSEFDVNALEKLLNALAIPNAKNLADQAVNQMIALAQGSIFEPPSALDLLPGLTAEQRKLVSGYITLLPRRTLVNANTASAEVLQAVVPGLDVSLAKSITTRRGQGNAGAYFATPQQFTQQIPGFKQQGNAPIGVTTQYFEVSGIVLWDALTIEQRALVERKATAGGGLPTVDIVKVAYGPTMPEAIMNNRP